MAAKDLKIEETEFTVLDFETTGTASRFSRVIEIGMVKVKNHKITEKYSTLINPGLALSTFITNLTGITDSDLEDAPAFERVCDDIKNFIGDSVITAHNLKFDYSFLKNEFSRAETVLPDNPGLCTLKLARRLYPHLPSKSLGKVTSFLKIRHKNVHRALGDATVTAKILLKMIDRLNSEYNYEYLNELLSFQDYPSHKKTYTLTKKKLAENFVQLPESPGIYLFKNSKGKIIYVGKAKSIKKRVKNYFSSTAGRKAKKIVRTSSNLSYQSTNSELSALLTEAATIKSENPAMNTMLKKFSNNYFIKIRNTHNYPDLSITTKFDFDGNDYFGPYNNRDITSKLVEIADKTYALRECKDKEMKKGKKCYLYDIKRCLGPCLVSEKISLYDEELLKVKEFLAGKNQDALNRLLARMKNFSDLKKYEDAASTRDLINLLLSQLHKASVLREPINEAKVLIKILDTTEPDYLLLFDGKVFLKDSPLLKGDYFDPALEDYFSGSMNIFQKITDKDLEQLKISLSWLIRNRNKVKIYHLTDYKNLDALTKVMS